MAWRALWSSLPLLFLQGAQAPAVLRHSMDVLFGVRALLTVATQVTFIYAITSAASAVAWPILNTTGLMAMALSSLLLREKPSRLEFLVILAITLLAVVRYLTLP
ncbi:EamA family transporter [Acidovorax sp. NCPPB 3859]|nr:MULTISPECIES: EamA family transporter [unclassified Acidovorax]MDA8451892.1 EamA family transporter [Acidovorax sp. GBBC 3297]MDA8461338.1 EamA family transporter [Acidovorax sp. GBBC 3333]MDA8466371.1 EamA family transporter [Acidovorax sp. GBBC 3332]MDA8471407.1 EamA family transporter [Acidovorax sp. GBBC 3299]WCM80038.1 EamA family transporter [Acidovorax sp. GBBC 712]